MFPRKVLWGLLQGDSTDLLGFCVFLVDVMTAASYCSSGRILTQWGLGSTPAPAVQATSSRAGSVAAL